MSTDSIQGANPTPYLRSLGLLTSHSQPQPSSHREEQKAIVADCAPLIKIGGQTSHSGAASFWERQSEEHHFLKGWQEKDLSPKAEISKSTSPTPMSLPFHHVSYSIWCTGGHPANLSHVFLEACVPNSFSALGLHPSNLPVWCFIASMLFQGPELV